MAELVIRKGLEKDIEQIVALEQICFAVPWSRESIIKDMTENKLAFYLVAELNETVIGYVGIWNVIDEGHINNVAVSPLYRRQHIGTVLIDTLIKATTEAGIKRHTLEVREGNEAARALYSKFGFKEAGVRAKYYEDNNEDAIIMWREEQ